MNIKNVFGHRITIKLKFSLLTIKSVERIVCSNKHLKNIIKNCALFLLFFCKDYKPWACNCFSNFLSKT